MNYASILRPIISTVHRGRNFEEYSLLALRQHLSMSLRRVGGRGDGGIDLQGWWWLPSACFHPRDRPYGASEPAERTRVRVVAQCKAEEKKLGPHYIRELEGVMLRNSAVRQETQIESWRGAIVGLVVSASPFTRASLLHAHSSPVPLALLHLPFKPTDTEWPPSSADDEGEYPGSIAFNASLCGSSGLFRGTIEPRWERCPSAYGGRPGIWTGDVRIPSWTPDEDIE